MNLNSVYTLAAGIQVRNEVFGLLFYDYRGPRLYFVPTQDLIPGSFFKGKQPVAELLNRLCRRTSWRREQIQGHVADVLAKLEGKGLVRGQSIC